MNGSLTIDNGRFMNQEITYAMYVRGDIRRRIMGIRNAFAAVQGYQRLEDTYNPEEFYLARYSEVAVDQSDRHRAGFKITFDRKPQRFLKTGEMPIEITAASSSIWNEEKFAALPLIRAYGTGSFSIGGVAVSISAADTYTDIDCELQEAYKDTLATNKNAYVTLTNGKFPQLNPGTNAVTITGLSKIIVYPRWWRL